jgi:hypothetical protein
MKSTGQPKKSVSLCVMGKDAAAMSYQRDLNYDVLQQDEFCLVPPREYSRKHAANIS